MPTLGANLGFYYISVIEYFAKVTFKPMNILQKSIDVWENPKYSHMKTEKS